MAYTYDDGIVDICERVNVAEPGISRSTTIVQGYHCISDMKRLVSCAIIPQSRQVIRWMK